MAIKNLIKHIAQADIYDFVKYPYVSGQTFYTEKNIFYQDISGERVATLGLFSNSNPLQTSPDAEDLAHLRGSIIAWFDSTSSTYKLYFVTPENDSGSSYPKLVEISNGATPEPVDLENIQRIRFNLNPTTSVVEGALSWDNVAGTLQIGMAGGSSLQIGQEMFIRCKSDGENILDGQAVYISGASGNNVLIKKATSAYQVDPASKANKIFGLATQNISSNAIGYITFSGRVNSVPIGNINIAETWLEGDSLFVSSTNPGMLTNVQPSAPNCKSVVGTVTRIAGSEVTILIGISRAHRISNLSDVHNGFSTNGEILAWNNDEHYFEPASEIVVDKIINKQDSNTYIEFLEPISENPAYKVKINGKLDAELDCGGW